MKIVNQENLKNKGYKEMERKTFTLKTPIMELLLEMSEGNPGAAVVLGELTQIEYGPMMLLHLDDMNIWGEQIWLLYKDVCGKDIHLMMDKIRKRDREAIRTINLRSQCKWLAVSSGASREGCREEKCYTNGTIEGGGVVG